MLSKLPPFRPPPEHQDSACVMPAPADSAQAVDSLITEVVADFLLESQAVEALRAVYYANHHLFPVRALSMAERSLRANVFELRSFGYLLYLHQGYRP